jgi:hypothetical protein
MERVLESVSKMFREAGRHVRGGDGRQDGYRSERRLAGRVQSVLETAPKGYEGLCHILWSFFYELADGDYRIEDIDVTQSRTPDELCQALVCVSRHPDTVKDLSYLLVQDHQSGEVFYDMFDELMGTSLSADSLAAQVMAGEILVEFEEHDPHMLVAGPGIRSYLNRSLSGEIINCTNMVNDISRTIGRLGRGTEELAECASQ